MQHKLIKIIITTQYNENYGAHDWDGIGECPQRWKNKGAHLFSLIMDSDEIMYDEKTCLDVIKAMVSKESNDYESFEYRKHEIEWNTPTELNSDSFQTMLNIERNNHLIGGVDFTENIEQLNKI
tara:strand:+ start:433 stop:804 length:372 start_codon:yes stop_codon:yes gene_type:complete